MNYQERIIQAVAPLQGTLFRVVESQEDIATARIVDNMQEQSRLEELLEGSKPAMPASSRKRHYLLTPPFRYPPLKYGSRYGRSFEPSLFYGAMSIPTALAETAFYRFVFISHLEKPFSRPLTTLHTVFSARFRTERGLRLHSETWQDLHQTLSDPFSYRESQAMGTDMRTQGVGAFQFLSARARQAGFYTLPLASDNGVEGVNVALFNPEAFRDAAPRTYQKLIAVTSSSQVSMSLSEADGSHRVFEFSLDDYLVDGQLPQPAP
ncbi:RES family NAD+ phosphorylase [Marinobacter daepoensis]|uniref:RES family NAD+ phosphorylase n=1 Tax=Marinobacter daepoensis TaxID=262077 RepID=UPI001C94605F|nr:RES family NAD+ phosphorylase [Marinobacter daepoensis]MBY6032254.1 RES family NAD+ phosphorylase [Marinobacter daepoensis]